jgi:predicted nucleic acid-binding protein
MSVRDKIFVDTLFIVASINQRDQYHQKALELAKAFENYPLITTDAVLLEVGNA